MDIRVDGYRSTNEDWLTAHRIPFDELPPITDEEKQVAKKLGISAEEYLRSRYAGDLSRKELERRAEVVGALLERWLIQRGLSGTVVGVWLKTLEGRFRVEIERPDGIQIVFLKEDLINDLLDSGSREAQEGLDRLLAANFGFSEAAQAS
jgi:hypothetical protein